MKLFLIGVNQQSISLFIFLRTIDGSTGLGLKNTFKNAVHCVIIDGHNFICDIIEL